MGGVWVAVSVCLCVSVCVCATATPKQRVRSTSDRLTCTVRFMFSTHDSCYDWNGTKTTTNKQAKHTTKTKQHKHAHAEISNNTWPKPPNTTALTQNVRLGLCAAINRVRRRAGPAHRRLIQRLSQAERATTIAATAAVRRHRASAGAVGERAQRQRVRARQTHEVGRALAECGGRVRQRRVREYRRVQGLIV